MAFCGDSGKEKQKDSPLKLKSTAEWKQRGDTLNAIPVQHLHSLTQFHFIKRLDVKKIKPFSSFHQHIKNSVIDDQL